MGHFRILYFLFGPCWVGGTGKLEMSFFHACVNLYHIACVSVDPKRKMDEK